MSEPFYTSRATVAKVQGTHRRVQLEAGPAFDTGVHGAIKRHYRLDDQPDFPLPVDFLAGATGA
jgi:hypothetical protein